MLVARAFRLLGVAELAGLLTGLVVGGVGSRLAMRAAAIATGPRCSALFTENGNRCGEITAEGTGFLLLFGALFFGTAGGLAYLVARPWLGPLGRWRGLVFGGLLLAAAGFTVIEGDNRDFRLFGSPLLTMAMFAALFPLFGLSFVPLFDRLEGALPPVPPLRPFRWRTLPGYLLLAGGSALGLLGIVALSGASPFRLGPLLALGLIWVHGWAARHDALPLGYGLLALPIGVGSFLTIRSAAEIF